MPAPSPNLLRYLRPYRLKAALGFVCVAGYIGASLWTPSLVGRAVDALQEGAASSRTFLGLMGLYLGVTAAAFVVSIGMRRLMLGLAHRVEHDIRRDLFAHLTGMDLAFFQRERTGDLMTKMTSDLSAVREMIGQGLLQGARMSIGFPLAFGIMFATNVQLALVVTALLPLVSLLFFFLIRWIHKLLRRLPGPVFHHLQLRPGNLLRHPHHQGLRPRGPASATNSARTTRSTSGAT
jgi:ATP-binding cassette subfamily B multidrug efflux pump